jgi:uncharacterized membrane protein YhhN
VSDATLPLAATLVCASAVASLVGAEVRHHRRGRYLWKPLASLAFCLVPVFAGALDGAGAFATWIMAGLILGAIGDVFLMFDHPRAFLGGLGSFLLGHVAYVIAFHHAVPIDHWAEGGLLGIAIAVAVIGAIILRYLWPRLGTMRGPVVAYILVISTMLVGGIAVAVRENVLSQDARVLAAAGAAAFYASDLAVARERFVSKGVWNRIIGLPVYYGAQLLIAWSICVR